MPLSWSDKWPFPVRGWVMLAFEHWGLDLRKKKRWLSVPGSEETQRPTYWMGRPLFAKLWVGGETFYLLSRR